MTKYPPQRTTAALLLSAVLFVSQHGNTSDAFTPLSPTALSSSTTSSWARKQTSRTRAVTTSRLMPLFNKSDEEDDEIERLKTMAAKLRAEAASLEAEQAQAMADAAEKAFRKFDTNQDGQISLEELKAGLEKAFKTELSEKRVQQLLEDFDKTGDGTLKLDEFVNVEQFRNRLDALAREEKEMARQAALDAKREEEAAQLVQATLDMINDKPPTGTDKILSILPYLFPLLDGLQYARFLIVENPDNILSALAGLTFALYRSIPLGGFIAFFALSFLSGNTRINRLIRFNMQQAIFLDITLIFPGLLSGLAAIAGGNSLPRALTELGNDAVFFSLMAVLGYCVVSSLLGATPNKIPLISSAVESRMPTMDMFDNEGRFQPTLPRQKDDEDDDKKKQ